ncbi:MAG: DUF1926 domain-containing protein [Treponema sp.]|jgi:hypothetical protein|nr:DUF1926 domain-containing protein [Treponema sp.]
MNGKINLILGCHAHVPYGAPEQEFESAYENILKPFVSNLYKYPNIQAALHFSGVLLHWVERTHLELFMLIEDMVSRKQAEVLGGGFYEPMLPVIPLQDKIGQIEMFTTYLRRNFGKRPLGCWIPALAWEQNLVSPVAACGMGYTFLSEKQFSEAGIAAENLFYPCLCEDQGKIVTVFPLCQQAEAALAEKNISTVLDDLRRRQVAEREMVVSIFPEKLRADPVESPDYTWNRFFEELSLCEFTETVMPGKLLKNLQGLKKVSFPDSTRKSAASGDGCVTPRRFLIEHPEADGIYSKMIFTGLLINQLKGDKSRKQSAREELWKSQGCGLFYSLDRQGLYRHSLRNAAYSALVGAERITREKGKFAPSLVPYDFNLDGTGEYLFQDTRINCYVQAAGGGIFELDYLPKAWNYLNTCGGRLAFADRLLPASIKLEELPCGPVAGGRLCRHERYELIDMDKVRRKVSFRLNAAENLPFGSVEIEKTFSLKKDIVTVAYSLCGKSAAKETFLFAPEIDLSFPGEGDCFTRFFVSRAGGKDTPPSESVLRGAESLKLQDLKNEVQIILSATQIFDGRIASVRISGLDDDCQYQATCVMPLFAVHLENGEKWNVEFNLKFSH